MDIALQIINLLWRNQDTAMTINEIAKQLNGTYSYVNRVVLKLIKENIISKKTVGHAFQCSLNKVSEKTKALLILSEVTKKEEYFQKHEKLALLFTDFQKELQQTVISIVLFGSYAKETFTKESDIDLLVVTHHRTDITRFVRKIHTLYSKNISPLTLTQDDFQQKKNELIIKEIVKNHIIIQGAEQFIAEVY